MHAIPSTLCLISAWVFFGWGHWAKPMTADSTRGLSWGTWFPAAFSMASLFCSLVCLGTSLGKMCASCFGRWSLFSFIFMGCAVGYGFLENIIFASAIDSWTTAWGYFFLHFLVWASLIIIAAIIALCGICGGKFTNEFNGCSRTMLFVSMFCFMGAAGVYTIWWLAVCAGDDGSININGVNILSFNVYVTQYMWEWIIACGWEGATTTLCLGYILKAFSQIEHRDELTEQFGGGQTYQDH